MTAEEYAQNWAVESRNYAKAGDYSWMSSLLPGKGFILEVGCGAGESTLAMVNSGRRVISVENNASLASLAYENLTSNGIDVRFCTMQEVECIDFSESKERVFLVVGSIFDEEIKNFNFEKNIDAIACWLIGSNPEVVAHKFKKVPETMDGKELALYRFSVQERCVELGRVFLANDGFVHLVDRSVISSWKDKDDYRKGFSELYREYKWIPQTLSANDVMFRKMGGAFASSSIQYMPSENYHGGGLNVFLSIKIKLREG